MEREQLEAMILERCRHCRLFAAVGAGDYLLPEEVLLTVIDSAYTAGREYQNNRIIQRYTELTLEDGGHELSVRIAE